MRRGKFASLTLIGLAVLLGFLILFPAILSFLEQAVIYGRNCNDPEAACASVAPRIADFVKPLGIVATGTFLVWVLRQRIHLLEIGGHWTAIASLWLLGSVPALATAHNFWDADFSLGILYVPLPFLLGYYIAFATFLCAVKYAPAQAPDQRQTRAWRVVMAVTGITLLLSAQTLLIGLQMVPYAGAIIDPRFQMLVGNITGFARLGIPLSVFLAFGFLVLSGAVAYIIYCQNRIEGAIAFGTHTPEDRPAAKTSSDPQVRRFGQRNAV
jgi:hypothetical protein